MGSVSGALPIQREGDIVQARQQARELARSLGFSTVDQSRIATAVSELTRNIIRYAAGAGGEVSFEVLQRDGRPKGLQVVVADAGPGIEDVERAMRHGYSSGPGMGLGLPGAKRLMDEFELETAVGAGTKVVMRKWLR